MITVSVTQMEALSRAQVDVANLAVADYVRRRFPERWTQTSQVDLMAWVGALRPQAEGFGLAQQDQLATFADLAVMYGDDFAAQAWAALRLTDAELDPAQRLDALVAAVRASGVQI